MKRLAAGVVAVVLVSSTPQAPGADHLVSAPLVDARLREASQRARDIATLRSFLSGPAARRAAAIVHLDPDAGARRLSALSDAELRDLARRATRLETDPRSGMSGGTRAVVVTLAVVVAILIVVYIIALVYFGTCGDCLGS